MNIVFCLYKYFRFGGLQRNCLMTARALVDRGHRVHVYTRDWDGEPPEWLTVTVLPVLAVMNVGKDNAFIKQVRKALAQEPYDCVVGFNRMPGLDVYYAADRCLVDRYPERTIFYRISRRYRRRTAWERASFGRDSTTEIMLIRSSER